MEEAHVDEGDNRRRRKGKQRADNQEKTQQSKGFFLEDELEEHHFNPFLPSSLNSSNSSLSKTQLRLPFILAGLYLCLSSWHLEKIGMENDTSYMLLSLLIGANLFEFAKRRTEVSRARWIEDIGIAEVIEKKGSMWVTTGVIRNGKLYCHIEEIGFLAQIGALVLVDEGDNIMDLKDIFMKCADRRYGCTWESFEAYRHLKSLGYVVGRHSQPWSSKHDRANSNSESIAHTDPGLIASRIKELQIGAASLFFDIHQPNSKFKKTDPGVPSFIICLVGDRPPSRREVENLEKKCKSIPLKFCHVSHDNVSFFSFPKVSLPVLP